MVRRLCIAESKYQSGCWRGLFTDLGEETILTGTTTFTGSVVAPASPANGNTRMRVRLTFTSGMAPCGAASFGETEDYTLVVTGGSDPYTYSWDNAGTLNNTSIANPIASPVSTTLYTVTVTDANNCPVQGSVTVNTTAPPNWYADTDNDGFGFGAPTAACIAPPGFVSNNTDNCPTTSNPHPSGCGSGRRG